MLVLGLESSCDETAASVVRDGEVVLSDVVASQVDVHRPYGGVVPELASRAHIVNVVPVLRGALDTAGVTLDDIDGIAVTQGPGLVGALLIAVQAAKAIAYARKIPLVGIHHLWGHMCAVYLRDVGEEPPAQELPFPHIALVVSGGHTSLIRVMAHGELVELGATRDDAAGEAFDKVAKLLGLGYPGGVAIDRLAKNGDAKAIAFPKVMTAADTKDDFSFSGLKTAVLNHVRKNGAPKTEQGMADLCASFQYSVVECLVRKTRKAVRREQLSHVQICGGVAANSELRRTMKEVGKEYDFDVFAPPPKRCTDNGSMIAAAGYHRLKLGHNDGTAIDASSRLPFHRF